MGDELQLVELYVTEVESPFRANSKGSTVEHNER